MASEGDDDASEDVAATLLRAVLASPDDVAPRLVYADWLTERGDPRGEFIRAQCEREGLADDDPRAAALTARLRQLLTAHEHAWIAPLRPLVMSWEFRRGFVETAVLPSAAAYAYTARGRRAWDGPEAPTPESVARLLALTPVRELEVDWTAGPTLAELAALPGGAGLRGLRVTGHPRHSDARVRAFLAGLDAFAALESLLLTALPASEPALVALARSPRLRALRSFALDGDARLDPPRGRAFFAEARFERLARLSLARTYLGPDGAAALARCGWVRGLEALRLHANDVLSEGAARIAGALGPALRSLELTECAIGPEGAAAIAASPALAGVRRLDLSNNGLSAAGAARVLTSPHLGALDALAIFNACGPGLARALGGARVTARPRELDVSRAGLTSEDLAALLGAGDLGASLRVLRASDNPLDAEGLARLARLDAPRLRVVVLARARLSTLRASHLAEARGLAALEELDLTAAELGDEGAEALAGCPALSRLEGLALLGNRLTARGARAIASSPHLRALKWLALTSNPIGDAGVEAIAASDSLGQLEVLYLAGTSMTDRGARALVASPRLPRLRTVHVSDYDLERATVDALAARFPAEERGDDWEET